jgi:biopolymer transport protein TolR
MAVFLPEGGARRHRAASVAELNLVPYIDLLTCMIAFLLITAVWTQMSRLEVAQRGPGGDDDHVERDLAKVTVLVAAEGFNLTVGDERQVLPRIERSYDFRSLRAALGRVKQQYPDKNDAQIASEDKIDFGSLVGTMDAVLAAGFPAVSLVGARAAGP